ncbi:hypothetical protein NMY22_g17660 [Coprinellus aureogranulatus]|nr:hypothetical protein NMY22_g17660 [Coprinellus aureogranulatus]
MSYSFDPRIANCSTEEWHPPDGQFPWSKSMPSGNSSRWRALWSQQWVLCEASQLADKPKVASDFILNPLSPPEYPTYGIPSGSRLKDCQCNTVFYNLINACATCQNGDIVMWTDYISPCEEVWVGSLPGGIPSGIAVPAELGSAEDVQKPPYDFNVEAAKAATGPDSIGPATSTRMGSTKSSTTTRPTADSTGGVITTVVTAEDRLESLGSTTHSSQTDPKVTTGAGTLSDPSPGGSLDSGPNNNDSPDPDAGAGNNEGPSPRNIGAIIGGAVGGFVAFLAILGLILICRRRRFKRFHSLSTPLAGEMHRNTFLQPFDISQEPPHYSGRQSPSQAGRTRRRMEGHAMELAMERCKSAKGHRIYPSSEISMSHYYVRLYQSINRTSVNRTGWVGARCPVVCLVELLYALSNEPLRD